MDWRPNFGASVGTIKWGSVSTDAFPAKAGPTNAPRTPRRTGFSREAFDLLLIFIHKRLSHRQSRLGCRLNAGLAQWAEPQGCGESAVADMDVRSARAHGARPE